MSTPAVSLRNVTKSFDGNAVLKGIDLDIGPGDVIGLVGENGAGKSTCMNIIAGSVPQDGGTISVDGIDVTGASVSDQLARGIRFVHQELSLVGALSVAENIFLGSYLAGPSGWVNRSRLIAAARDALARVRAGHIDPEALVASLRAGDQQLVEIAKALTIKPRLLIMDEPTSSLTGHEASALFSIIRELSEAGTAVILITHRLEEVLAVCRRVVVLRDGAKVSDRAGPLTRDQILADMIGRIIGTDAGATRPLNSEIVLRCREVSDGTLSGVTFEAHAGEILGVFGLVGSGRTELLETLYGARARTGELASHRRGSSEPALIHMVTESRKMSGIFPSHSVEENMTISALGRIIRNGLLSGRAERDQAQTLKTRFRIRAAALDLPITSLSGGNQQKALLARAYFTNADILLLDEPTHGVDVGAKEEIYGLIREMADTGITVIFASSEIPELLALADRCLVLSQQSLAGVLTHEEMSEQRLLALAFSRH